MKEIFLISKSELRKVITEILANTTLTQAAPEPEKNLMPLAEVPEYLATKGVTLSLSSLYKLTSNKEIPFKRFGKRKIVFERAELDKWVEKRMTGKSCNIAEHVAKSAQRKLN